MDQSMHQLRLAQYAYHNCELSEALHFTQALHSAEGQALAIKILCEMDQADVAMAQAMALSAKFPEDGLYSYLAGMSAYLAGKDRELVTSFFQMAIEKRHPAGHLGMAFIHFANDNPEQAEGLLSTVRLSDPELDHIRYLMLFQVRSGDQNEQAEAALRAADDILSANPSLLRHLWGQLCWVRHLRVTGSSDGAMTLLVRLESLISQQQTPRLARNITVARQLLESQNSSTQTLNLPPAECPGPIRRKPILYAMFIFLNGRSGAGVSKEDLAEQIWQESYNPVVHDDRIYKSINRLRRALGDDVKEPQILTQVGRNYFLNIRNTPGEHHE